MGFEPSCKLLSKLGTGYYKIIIIVCVVFDCGTEGLSRPENGRPVDITTTTFGSVATFSCMDGFILVGNEERRCELAGWTGSNPTCEGEFQVPHYQWGVDINFSKGVEPSL